MSNCFYLTIQHASYFQFKNNYTFKQHKLRLIIEIVLIHHHSSSMLLQVTSQSHLSFSFHYEKLVNPPPTWARTLLLPRARTLFLPRPEPSSYLGQNPPPTRPGTGRWGYLSTMQRLIFGEFNSISCF